MWNVIFSMLLPSTAWFVHGQQMDEFARAVMLSLGNTNPAFVLDPEQNPTWARTWTQSGWQNSVIIPAVTDPEEVETIISNLDNLLRMDEIDFIFFMTPIEPEHVSGFVDKIGSLWPTASMLVPYEYPTSFPLQLDSRLFFYKTSESSVALFEKFHIRQVNISFYISSNELTIPI